MSLLVQSELTGLLDKVLKENGRLRKGNNLQYHCPFCNHRKRKLEICLESPYPWQCWVCHEKGNGVRYLLKRINAPESSFKELEKTGIKEESYRPKETTESEKVLTLPQEFKSLTINDGSREYREAIRYAVKRGITPFDVVKHNIGYCTEGRYRNRLIFPSYDKNNQLNFFTGRSYYDDVYLKYDNCDAPRDIIGFENMVDFHYPINLVEGPLDAISVKRNVIPLFGTYPSTKLKTELIQHKPDVNIILDPDAIKHSLQIADFLISIGLKTKLVEIKGDEDAGSLGFQKITQSIKETEYLDFSRIMRLRLGF
jgi:hypothetical protein